MASITNEEINNIRNQANIVDIIGSYVSLEKKGKNYFGVCPFHDDHNPSMSVSEEKGVYTCFVCHKTGNVFGFVQDIENISFIEAVKKVADTIGINIDIGEKVISKYEKLYEINDFAMKYYQNNLNTASGKKALEYLNKRHIDEDIINEFNIGYAGSDDNTLTKILNQKYDDNDLINSGISNQGTNNLYDLFRDRITFPIHNSNGRVVAFSSRIYETKDEAKYINTKETSIFKKGEILFNYHRAVNEAKRKGNIVLVEGQMDAIRVYASGMKNVIATMGTALTDEHIKLLKKLNTKVTLCMDNDEAGEKATIKNGELLVNAGIETLVLRLSGQKDPDEYIISNGIDKYIDAVNNAITYFDFKMNVLKKNKNMNNVFDVSKYINDVTSYLSTCTDQVLIDLTVNNLSKEYGINKNDILNKIIKVDNKTNITELKETKKKVDKIARLCEEMIYFMLSDTKFIELYNQELGYLPNKLYEDIANDILAFFLKYNYINMADFITYEISNEGYETVLNIIDNNINLEIKDNDFIGIIEKIKEFSLENKIKSLKEKLKGVTDINEKLKILDEISNLKKKVC